MYIKHKTTPLTYLPTVVGDRQVMYLRENSIGSMYNALENAALCTYSMSARDPRTQTALATSVNVSVPNVWVRKAFSLHAVLYNNLPALLPRLRLARNMRRYQL